MIRASSKKRTEGQLGKSPYLFFLKQMIQYSQLYHNYNHGNNIWKAGQLPLVCLEKLLFKTTEHLK